MKGDIVLKKTNIIEVKCEFNGEESLQEILIQSFRLFLNNKIVNSTTEGDLEEKK